MTQRTKDILRKSIVISVIVALVIFAGFSKASRKDDAALNNSDTQTNEVSTISEETQLLDQKDPSKKKTTYLVLAGTQMKKGDSQSALDNLEKAIALDPDNMLQPSNVDILSGEMVVYLEREDKLKVIETATRIILIDPLHFQAYLTRGGAYAELGEDDKAISDFEAALKIDPTSEDASAMRDMLLKKR